MGVLEKEKKVNLLGELSGSLGDLGTFLPYVLGAISIAAFNPASIFTGFGLFYIFCGWFYQIPMAVQPMKVASAAVLVHHLTPDEVAAAGLITGMVLLLLGLTGLIDFIGRITPLAVISGIQMGLGVSLAVLGVKLIVTEPFIGWPIIILMLPLLKSKRFPAAIAAVLAGVALNLFLSPSQSWPAISLGIHLPEINFPAAVNFKRGFFLAALPQLPLTLTNAVLVTTALSQELFGPRAAKVSDRNLCLTMGAANLISAPLGGYMMCHGGGGVAAHHRFGGRTKYTSYIIGAILLAMGLFLGNEGTKIFALIPEAALGCLLFYSGIDLASAAKHTEKKQEFYVILSVAVFSLAINPAVAFIAGFILAKGIEKTWLRV